MECKNCGAQTSVTTFYCGGCGRPVSFEPVGVATEEEPPAAITDVPAPGPSLESFDSIPPPSSPAVDVIERKALCCLCMGSYSEASLSFVEGKRYCSDCNPLRVRHVRHPGVGVVPPPVDGAAGFEMYAGPQERTAGGGARLLLGGFVLVLVAGVIFAAVSLMGRDRIDRLIAGADLNRTDARLLTQKYVEGDSLSYGLSMSADVTMDSPMGQSPLAGSGEIEMSMSTVGSMRVSVLSVDAEGNARLLVDVSRMTPSGTMKVDGRPMPLASAGFGGTAGQGPKSMEIEVDPFGEVRSPNGGEEGFSEFLNGGFKGMPRHELKVGDSWTAEESIPGIGSEMAAGMQPMLTATYRVEGYKEMQGRDCVVISIEGELAGSGGIPDSAPPGMEMDAEMDVDLKGVVFFDPDAGVMVRCAMDIDLDMSMVLGGMSMSASGVIRIDINLQ